MEDCFDLFNALNIGDDRVDVDTAADSYSVTLPLEGAGLLSQVENVADAVVSTANLVNSNVALNHMPKLEVSSIVLEILDISLRGHKIRGIIWETKVGESS